MVTYEFVHRLKLKLPVLAAHLSRYAKPVQIDCTRMNGHARSSTLENEEPERREQVLERKGNYDRGFRITEMS